MRNVIVTGGSRGLGLGIAQALAASGYCVVAIARRETPELAAAIRGAEVAKQGSIRFKPFDLAATAKLHDLVTELRGDVGPIYGLVNNAGIGTGGLLATMQDSEIENLVQLNTFSVLILTKYVLRSMMAAGVGGRIVNISSIVSFTGYKGLSVYSATKSSLGGFTRALAREVGQLGITVNAVAPGFVDTDMTESLAGEQRASVVRRSALRRLVGVDDIAGAVEFLLGDKAKNITGTTLTVDAGSTA
jgi:3-oxoacyl-[acyl-carrier protein] reductase